jgi:hypothetical protein
LSDATLAITIDYKVAWINGAKMTKLVEVNTSYPHIRVGGVFYGAIYLSDAFKVVDTIDNECRYEMARKGTRIIGEGRMCIITLGMTWYLAEPEKPFRTKCDCDSAAPAFDEFCP